jgi:hypothetical protein
MLRWMYKEGFRLQASVLDLLRSNPTAFACRYLRRLENPRRRQQQTHLKPET